MGKLEKGTTQNGGLTERGPGLETKDGAREGEREKTGERGGTEASQVKRVVTKEGVVGWLGDN